MRYWLYYAIKAKRLILNQRRSKKMIRIKNSKEISQMKDSCRMAAEVLVLLNEHIQEGISTYDIDRLAHEYITKNGGYPSTLNYHGFPKSICTSINNVVCHGIPKKKERLKSGDIINVDVTVFYKGYHGDTSRMYTIDNISKQAMRLIKITEEAMYRGIAAISPNKRLGDMGHAIQSFVEQNGFSVVRDFIGHGVGKEFHEDPPIPHVGKPGTGVRLKPGMTFTIEPMINQGRYEVEIEKDKWTVVTKDKSLSAQFEHTILVTNDGHEILTLLPDMPNNGKIFI